MTYAAVAMASAQKDFGSFDSSNMVFAMVESIWFIRSASPFCSRVSGADVSCRTPSSRSCPLKCARQVLDALELALFYHVANPVHGDMSHALVQCVYVNGHVCCFLWKDRSCVRMIQACPMLSGHDWSLSLVDGTCTGVSGEEGRQSSFRQFVDRNESDPEVWYKEYV